MNGLPVRQWLTERTPGFAGLPEAERTAITDFCMLWSLFEDQCCNRNANIPALQAVSARIDFSVPERLSALDGPLAYFQERYVDGEAFTYRFEHLNFRKGDRRAHVEAVLRGQSETPTDILLALLIIVYRFRNNLFHGEKWAYQLKEQQSNFETSNALLMWVMDHAPKQP